MSRAQIQNDTSSATASTMLSRTTNLIRLEQIAQRIAVYEIDRRDAVPCRFGLGIAGEGARGDDHALLAAAGHGATKVP